MDFGMKKAFNYSWNPDVLPNAKIIANFIERSCSDSHNACMNFN